MDDGPEIDLAAIGELANAGRTLYVELDADAGAPDFVARLLAGETLRVRAGLEVGAGAAASEPPQELVHAVLAALRNRL